MFDSVLSTTLIKLSQDNLKYNFIDQKFYAIQTRFSVIANGKLSYFVNYLIQKVKCCN